MLGDLILEEKAKPTGVRVLPDGKIEQSYQAAGKFLDMESTSMYTLLVSMSPDGTSVSEGTGVTMTRDGASMVKVSGVGKVTGSGFKASSRGGGIIYTASPKLARFNNSFCVWEAESDEAGNGQLKVWEWK